MGDYNHIGSFCQDSEAREIVYKIKGPRLIIKEKVSGPWVKLVYDRPVITNKLWLSLEELKQSHALKDSSSVDSFLKSYLVEDVYLQDLADECEARGIAFRYTY